MKTVSKWPFVFYNETENFESHTQIYLFIISLVSILKNRKNYDFEISCFAFLQWKTKLETLLNFELHFIHKTGYKNKDYRKLVTSLYNGFLKLVVPQTTASSYLQQGKTAVKRWVLCKTPCKNDERKLNCDYTRKKGTNYSSR